MHIFVRDVYYKMHLRKCKRNRGLLARKTVKNQYLKTRGARGNDVTVITPLRGGQKP